MNPSAPLPKAAPAISKNANAVAATTAPASTVSSEPKPWHRLPDEPNLWYDRFLAYLSLGPGRTIEKLYRLRCETHETDLAGKRASSSWHAKAREWRWDERAAVYDEQSRQEDLTAESKRRLEAREHRRKIVDTYLDQVTAAIDLAELENLDTPTARMHLQTLTTMLVNLLKAHRLEMGEPTEIQEGNIVSTTIQFTADDLAEAQRQLEQYQRQHEETHAPA